MKYKFLCVDFQNEFVHPNGIWFQHDCESIDFIRKTLTPFLKKKKIKASEIISDYRQPRPGDLGEGCFPGTMGYESALSKDIKSSSQWIKSMSSPVWIRDNIGSPLAFAGVPYQDPKKFNAWLHKEFGEADETFEIIVFGLMLDESVFCTCQELGWRGYSVKVLTEATDVRRCKERPNVKNQLISGGIMEWLKFISFEELKKVVK